MKLSSPPPRPTCPRIEDGSVVEMGALILGRGWDLDDFSSSFVSNPLYSGTFHQSANCAVMGIRYFSVSRVRSADFGKVRKRWTLNAGMMAIANVSRTSIFRYSDGHDGYNRQ